eukprot:jgi/Mesvir1/11324/Mv02074-RA.1
MSSSIIFANNATSEDAGRLWDPSLDFTVNYPVNAMPQYLSLGGRIEPSLDSMRVRGGSAAINQNRSLLIDDRVMAPYANMYWDQMKRGDRYVDGLTPMLTDIPPGLIDGYSV